MNLSETLEKLSRQWHGDRKPVMLGAIATALWLVLIGVVSATSGSSEPTEAGADTPWLMWVLGLFLPLVLIWFAVWSAQSLAALQREAATLRALLSAMRDGNLPARSDQRTKDAEHPPQAEPPQYADDDVPPRPRHLPPQSARPQAPSQPRRAPTPRPAAAANDPAQSQMQFDRAPAPDLTLPELFLALNFPDGPEDREAIRCLRLALADADLARLIRAAQDVVTLLAGQGVYMDEFGLEPPNAALWRQFANGARGEPVADLAVIQDDSALDIAATMMRGDEVFRDVAHHFLRHFDRLLNRHAQTGDDQELGVLIETRSGRAFTLLAQVTGMLGARG